jgi:hypothetical protein
MSTADRVGEVVGTVMLITDPPSPEPIEVMVRALVQSSPRLVQRGAVRVRTSLSTTSPFQVSVEAIRPLDQQPFRWDEERSELSGMHVEDYQTTETLRDSASKVQAASIRELHTWTLTPPGELPLGEHSFNLLMEWSDRSTVEIPVVVIVEHPLRLSLDRVYFGELSPSERKVVRVYVRGAAREEASNVDAQVDLSFVTARYEDSEAAVRLEVSAPGECGPFAGHLSVSLAGKPVPVAVIPISGTVRPPDERSSN